MTGNCIRRAAFFVFATLCLSGHALSQEILKWGGDPSGGAPYVYNDPANPQQYIGFDVDIANEIGRRLHRKAELVKTDWESIVSALKREEFDIIVDGFEPTGDRAKDVLFSNPYFLFRLQLTVRVNENSIRSIDDCRRAGKTVGTLVNCAASRLLENENVPMKPYADPVAAYEDLEFGRIDAVLMDIPMEMFYARNNKAFKPAGQPFHTGAYVVGIRKQDTVLLRQVNKAITEMVADGSVERIFRKWNLYDDEQQKLKSGSAEYEITTKKFNWSEALIKLTKAAGVTILIAFAAMLIAVLLGVPLSVGQMHGNAPLRWGCTAYIEFFRGTPVLVQLLFLYFGLPVIGITLPGWLTAMVGLGLNYAAYESQVYRTAFQAIPQRQWDVAYSLGMKPLLTFRRIIFPQAIRIALPPMTNDFVALFKDTSTAFAIAVWELATAYREMANATGSYLLLGGIVSLYYLAMSVPVAQFAKRLERKLNRASRRIASGDEL